MNLKEADPLSYITIIDSTAQKVKMPKNIYNKFLERFNGYCAGQ